MICIEIYDGTVASFVRNQILPKMILIIIFLSLKGGLVAFFLIDRLGRKKTLAFGFLLAASSFLLLMICSNR